MTTYKLITECKWCKTPLLSINIGRCPECGKIGKRVYTEFTEVISLKDLFNWELRREFLKENKLIKFFLIFINFGSPFLGLIISGSFGFVVGLIIAFISHILGPFAIIKIREIIKGNSS